MRHLSMIGLAAALASPDGPALAQDEAAVALAPVDGGRIEYVVSGPEDGEPLLLIHGGSLATALMRVQEQSALSGYRTIRVHARGYAGSSDLPAYPSMPEVAADMRGLLDALDVERAHVAGHSRGGAISMQLAADAPERVASLVLIDSFAPRGFGPGAPPPDAGAPPDAAGAASFAPLAAARARAQDLLAAGDREGAIGAFYGFIFGPDWRDYFDAVPGGMAQAIKDAPFDLGSEVPAWDFGPADVAEVEQAVLVLRGAESPVWPADATADFVAGFPAAEGAAVADTDHALITQKPDEVAAAIADFLARHPM